MNELTLPTGMQKYMNQYETPCPKMKEKTTVMEKEQHSLQKGKKNGIKERSNN